MGAVTQEYANSSNLTVTNLHSLASSQGGLSGWGSAVIDNTIDKHLDKQISAKFTKAATNLQAGSIKVYFVTMLDDSNWPSGALSSGTFGTEGALTWLDDEQLREYAQLVWVNDVDTGASEPHHMPFKSPQLVYGVCPPKFIVYITGNCTTTTTAQFAASGNQVTVKGSYLNVA